MADHDNINIEKVDSKNIERKVPDKIQQVLAAAGTVPEGEWGWVIVFSICVQLTVLFGYVFSLSVFYVEWISYFDDASATDLSWVLSLTPAIAGILKFWPGTCSKCPVAGALCTKFGSRKVALVGSAIIFAGAISAVFSQTVTHLYLTIGFLVGGGTALTFSPSLVLLGHYFQRRYVLANSIAFCGYSFAQMVIPRLTQLLIQEYGWRGALLIQAAMLSNLFVCSALLRPRITPKPPMPPKAKQCFHISGVNMLEQQPKNKEICTSTTSLAMYDDMWIPTRSTSELYQHEERSRQDVNSKKEKRCNPLSHLSTHIVKSVSFLKETYGISALSKSVLYIVTLACSFTGGVGWFVTSGHLVARAVSAGISRNDAAFLITLVGIGSFIGRAGHGIIIDKGWISRQVMFTVAFGVTGILSLLNPLMDTFVLLCVFGVLFGFAHGIANSLVFAMMKLQVARTEAAAALSFGTLVLACSNTVGGVLGGFFYDVTGNYDISFYFAGAMIFIGTVILSIVYVINHFKKP